MEGDVQIIKAGQRVQPSKQYPSLCLVSSGYIKRYLVSPDKHVSIQSIYGPGDIFPLTPIFKLVFDQHIYEGPTKYHYGAITDVELYSIENKSLLRTIKNDPSLYKDLFAQAGRRLQSNIQQLENAGLKDPYRRVCHQLAFLARHFGILNQEGVTIPLPLSVEDLAALLNLTSEDVASSLKRLKQAGLIKGNLKLQMPDMQTLVNQAYS